MIELRVIKRRKGMDQYKNRIKTDILKQNFIKATHTHTQINSQ